MQRRVAAELGIDPKTARRWMADGTIPTLVVPDATDVPRRHALLSVVFQLRESLAGRILLPDLAGELGLRYHEAYNMLRCVGIDVEQRYGNREHQLTAEAAEVLRAEHRRTEALHRRSIKLAAAARQLKIAVSTAGVLLKRGELDPILRAIAAAPSSLPALRFNAAGSLVAPRDTDTNSNLPVSRSPKCSLHGPEHWGADGSRASRPA
jgi:hypothetical protein